MTAHRCFSEDEIKKGFHDLGWPYFRDIFMVSAFEDDRIDFLRKYIIANAVTEKWLYDEDTPKDVPVEKLVLKIVKAKRLEPLPQKVPYEVKPELEYWVESDSGLRKVILKVNCPKEQYRWIIIGTNGSVIKTINSLKQPPKPSGGCHYQPLL